MSSPAAMRDRPDVKAYVRAARRAAFGVFYALPGSLRRRLVRLASGKYVVGAVALIRDNQTPPRMLLLRQPPGPGWGLPAGLLQRGESPAEGCARELAEESGLVLSSDDLRPAVPSAVFHHRGRWVDVVFEAQVDSSAVSLSVDGAEVLDAAWHRIDALPPMMPAAARLLAHYGIGPYAPYPEVRQ